MSDKIAEIRARHEFAGTHMRPAEFYWTIPGWIAHIDRAFLLAEVEDLRDETERLQSNNDNLTLECGEARAEVERLRVSNERLHRALFRIAGKAPFADDPWTIARKAMKREAKP